MSHGGRRPNAGRSKEFCLTCGAGFLSVKGGKPCPKPSPGREYVDTGRGGHMFVAKQRGGKRAGAGRKRTTGPLAPPPVSFRLPADLYRELGEYAQREGVSRHGLAAGIVKVWLSAMTKAEDDATRTERPIGRT